MMDTMELLDIPDLSEMAEGDRQSEPWTNGWYGGRILEQRQFTDKNGNDRVFVSSDEPSQNGSSRNIRLQVVVTRADGRELNLSALVNYRPEDLTTETVQAVAARRAQVKTGETEWGDLFRANMTLTRLGKLQKLAGVRNFARNGNGGLDLHGLYGKSAFFKLADDDRNSQYKMIKDYRADRPTKVPVL